MGKYENFLKEIPFFSPLPDNDIKRLEELCIKETYSKDQVIINEGDPGDYFYIILEGVVEIWKGFNTLNQDLLAIYKTGSFFGELALIARDKRSASVVARKPTTLLLIDGDKFNSIISESTDLSLSILRSVTAMVRRRTEEYVENLRRTKRHLEKAYKELKDEIRERKKIEKKLVQSQKMEALATLAGGIAHEFNNLMMCIQGNISMMLLNTAPEDGSYKRLKDIEKFIQQGAFLTKNILTFARDSKYSDLKTADINEILQKTLKKFRQKKRGMDILEKYKEDIWRALVNKKQLEEVFLNLCNNAYEAMPNGGTLFIHTDNKFLDEKEAGRMQVTPGSYIKVSLADRGIGIDEDCQVRMFDPFFTTKERAERTGLGLSAAYGIIKNHGGAIEVSSRLGQGTEFNIYLPGFR